MALTFSRWLAGVVVACGLIWTGLFRTPKDVAPPISVDQNREPGIRPIAGRPPTRPEVMRVTDRLRLLQIRDSILASTKGPRAGLSLEIDPRFASARALLDSIVRSQWSALGAPAARPVIVAAIVDTATTIRGLPANAFGWRLPITVFLPRGADDPCLSIIRIPAPIDNTTPSFVRRYLQSPVTISSLVSPCAYFAAFGRPGPHLERWLATTSWRYAISTNWPERAPEWKSPGYFPRGMALGMGGFRDGELELRSRLTAQGQACVTGRAGACTAAALPGNRTLADSVWRWNVVSAAGAVPGSFYARSAQSALGPSDAWVLSDLVHDLGAERFAAFWRSPLPVDSAFASVSGQSFDAWLHAWTGRVYGTFPTGPTLATSSAVIAFAWIPLGLAIAMVSAQRRRIS